MTAWVLTAAWGRATGGGQRKAGGRMAAVLVAGLLLTGCSAETDTTSPGERVYNRYCFSCHAAGIAGAPRVGDPQPWVDRVARGREALLQTTISGIAPGMPPRGLCSECTDEELAAAIDYMIERSVPEEAESAMAE